MPTKEERLCPSDDLQPMLLRSNSAPSYPSIEMKTSPQVVTSQIGCIDAPRCAYQALKSNVVSRRTTPARALISDCDVTEDYDASESFGVCSCPEFRELSGDQHGNIHDFSRNIKNHRIPNVKNDIQPVKWEEDGACVDLMGDNRRMVSMDNCWQQDNDGDTALHLVVVHGMLGWLHTLLRFLPRRSLLDIQNCLSQTALHLAVITRNTIAIKLLRRQGARLDVRDRHGNTPMHLACQRGDLASLRALTDKCDVTDGTNSITKIASLFNYNGDSCLHLAASSGNCIEVVDWLLGSHVDCDVNLPDGRSGRTIFHHAVERRNMPLLSYLLVKMAETGLDVDAETYGGQTALCLALARGYGDAAEFLLLAGASRYLVLDDSSESDSDESQSDSPDERTESAEDSYDSDSDCEYDDLHIGGVPVSA